ncbi:hypothetical protein [Paenibacillus sp. NPDC058071]|uniref:hypothetical protein n=1 Tax=Paenibacillus sp. NPDC058071 TaxID=3346326 RepID=UPI0036DD8BD2
MNMGQHDSSNRPASLWIVQLLLYFSGGLNIVNGIISFGSADAVKKSLSIAMLVLGVAAIFVALRLSTPKPASLRAAVVLSIVMIVLRIAEYAVWHSVGFLLGIILPIVVLWRLNSPEIKARFR